MKALSSLLLFSFFFSSCAGWIQRGEEKTKKNSNITIEKKTKIYLEFKNKDEYTMKHKNPSKLFKNIIKKNGFEVVKDPKQADIQLAIRLEKQEISNKTLNILNYATLFLVPAKKEYTYNISAEFLAQDQQLGQIEKVQTSYIYRQLFLIFAMPFLPPFGLEDEALTQGFDSIIKEAFDEGIIGQSRRYMPE